MFLSVSFININYLSLWLCCSSTLLDLRCITDTGSYSTKVCWMQSWIWPTISSEQGLRRQKPQQHEHSGQLIHWKSWGFLKLTLPVVSAFLWAAINILEGASQAISDWATGQWSRVPWSHTKGTNQLHELKPSLPSGRGSPASSEQHRFEITDRAEHLLCTQELCNFERTLFSESGSFLFFWLTSGSLWSLY